MYCEFLNVKQFISQKNIYNCSMGHVSRHRVGGDNGLGAKKKRWPLNWIRLE
jgi:hypothetical protein